MNKTQNHQAAAVKASAAGRARGFGLKAGFYATGVSRNAVRAGDADDAIAEAMAERAERNEGKRR